MQHKVSLPQMRTALTSATACLWVQLTLSKEPKALQGKVVVYSQNADKLANNYLTHHSQSHTYHDTSSESQHVLKPHGSQERPDR